MKTPVRIPHAVLLLSINAAAAVLFSGCATPDKHSFNHDFGESLQTNPEYRIKDENDHSFKITVEQGSPSEGAERVIDLKKAATSVAKTESQKLGWERWEVNYIQERDQGWMHVVVAEVTRK